MQDKVMMYKIRSGVIRWQVMAIVMSALISHHLQDIRKSKKSLTLKVKVQVMEEKNGTCAIRLKTFDPISDVFRILTTWKYTFTQTWTHIHTDTHLQTHTETYMGYD